MKNFIFCTVLPTGASKVVQTHNFDDFLDLTQFWPDRVLIEIKVIRNNNMNNFEWDNKLSRIYSFHAMSLWSFKKFSHFLRQNRFWSTLEDPREKTVHLRELVMSFKVVLNNIVDIIHFDQNTIRSNLKELCKI